jgi:hypothetical protein
MLSQVPPSPVLVGGHGDVGGGPSGVRYSLMHGAARHVHHVPDLYRTLYQFLKGVGGDLGGHVGHSLLHSAARHAPHMSDARVKQACLLERAPRASDAHPLSAHRWVAGVRKRVT